MKVIVVGGGAAGMMAAIWAARNGAEVSLFEKNEKLGKKIFITGKGRCNLTNACDVEDLFRNVPTNPKFLYSAFYGFDNAQTMSFFEELGLPIKVERGDRVFPVSDHSSDVIKVLERECKRLGVRICLQTCVSKLLVTEGIIRGIRLSDGQEWFADKVIVATGGLSYSRTGSTGDGFQFAEDTGHKLAKDYPSLVPFNIREDWCKDLMGLALKNVSVKVIQEKKKVYEGFGEMLFTHFGVSGPLIISASAYVHRYLGKPLSLYIDLKPALSREQLDERILRDFEKFQNKQFKHALDELLPKRLISVMVELSGINPDKKVNSVSKAERMVILDLMKSLPLTITSLRDYDEAIITKGGVSVKDVNPSTMESKKVKGLYFAGELLDVDALTGGFNLQIAWSTGYIAGNCCCEK